MATPAPQPTDEQKKAMAEKQAIASTPSPDILFDSAGNQFVAPTTSPSAGMQAAAAQAGVTPVVSNPVADYQGSMVAATTPKTPLPGSDPSVPVPAPGTMTIPAPVPGTIWPFTGNYERKNGISVPNAGTPVPVAAPFDLNKAVEGAQPTIDAAKAALQNNLSPASWSNTVYGDAARFGKDVYGGMVDNLQNTEDWFKDTYKNGGFNSLPLIGKNLNSAIKNYGNTMVDSSKTLGDAINQSPVGKAELAVQNFTTGAEDPKIDPSQVSEIPDRPVLPPNTKFEPDGALTKTIYDDKGNYLGYGTRSVTPTVATGVGKIDGMDSDVANQKLANSLKARGILNDGSDAFKINEQINQAIKNGQRFDGLLTQFDKASNRPPVNPEIPKAPEPEIEHNPFGDSTTDQVTAALGGRDKLYEDNLPDYSKVRAMAAKEAQLEAANPGQRAARLAEVKKQDQDSWNRYYAEREMRQALADQPNDDPVWNAHIAKNQANAAHSMAIANGATEQQLKEHPEMMDKYLRDPNDFDSPGSQRQTNNLAMEAIRGKSTPELITSSMNSESLPGNNHYRQELNRQAIAATNSQAGVDSKADRAMYMSAHLNDLEQFQNSKIDPKIKMAVQEYDRLISQKTAAMGAVEKSLGIMAKPGNPQYDRAAKAIQDVSDARWKYLQDKGLADDMAKFPDVAESQAPAPVTAASLPPADKREDGKSYVINGKTLIWHKGKGFTSA